MFKVTQEMIELILNPCSSDPKMSFHHSSLACLCHSGPATFNLSSPALKCCFIF